VSFALSLRARDNTQHRARAGRIMGDDPSPSNLARRTIYDYPAMYRAHVSAQGG
jgi:hypothetical protein